MNRFNKRSGQSLIEIIIAITIGALIVGSAAGALMFTIRSNQQSRATDMASTLAQEILDQIRSVSDGNWQNLYNLSAKGGPTQSCPPHCYHLGAGLNIVAGSEAGPPLNINNIQYTRYFTVENVNRDNCGTREIVTGAETSCSASQTGIFNDPSTQKVTAKVTWRQGGDTAEVVVSEYFTRARNEVNQFTDWSGLSGVAGPVPRPTRDYFGKSATIDATTTPGSLRLTPGTVVNGWLISSTLDTEYTNGVAFNSVMWRGNLGTGQNSVRFQLGSSNTTIGAETTGPIDFTNRYAWNSIIGWLDFYGAPGGPATVTTAKMTRWATSSDGAFALDCATTPGGNICATSNFFVSHSAGNLAGWAWNDTYGWVSFCGNSASGSTWSGSTWVCPASPAYQVTINQANGQLHGWAWNDIIGWISFNCLEPGVCAASNYKVAVAGVADTWTYIGPDGTSATFYISTGPDAPAPVVTAHHNNKRYYRYKVYLDFREILAGNTAPVVDDVMVNWSP